jgi:hypothetical protein
VEGIVASFLFVATEVQKVNVKGQENLGRYPRLDKLERLVVGKKAGKSIGGSTAPTSSLMIPIYVRKTYAPHTPLSMLKIATTPIVTANVTQDYRKYAHG